MAKMRLLGLDGGGIRGLSTLYILEDLMHKIKVKQGLAEEPRPCDYFDMIAGTSTGGIIAIMLGRLRMRVSQCIVEYQRLSRSVFGHRNGPLSRTRYDPARLERAVGDVVERITGRRDSALFDETCTKTFVVCKNTLAIDTAVLLRSYTSSSVPVTCTIVDAALATSAAPTFFPPRLIAGQTYIDGGIGANNPSELLLDEARELFDQRMPDMLLSIGTGETEIPQVRPSSRVAAFRDRTGLSIAEVLANMATDCRDTHLLVEELLRDTSSLYFRWNVVRGLETVVMDEYDRADLIQTVTLRYLSTELNNELGTQTFADLLTSRGPAADQTAASSEHAETADGLASNVEHPNETATTSEHAATTDTGSSEATRQHQNLADATNNVRNARATPRAATRPTAQSTTDSRPVNRALPAQPADGSINIAGHNINRVGVIYGSATFS